MISIPQRLYRLIGQRIRNLRTSQGLKQEELGRRVSLSRTSITNIEQGKQRLLADQLFTFASAFGVELMQILPNKAELNATKEFSLIIADKKLSNDQRKWVEKVIVGKG